MKQPALEVLEGKPDEESVPEDSAEMPDVGGKQSKDSYLGLPQAEWEKLRDLQPVEGDIDPKSSTVSLMMKAMTASITIAQRAKIPDLDPKIVDQARQLIQTIRGSVAGTAPTEEEGLPTGPMPPKPMGPPAMGGPPMQGPQG